MPEINSVRTTMHGPANRIPMFNRDDKQVIDTDSESDEQENAGVDSHHAGPIGEHADLPLEPLNEQETIIGVDE